MEDYKFRKIKITEDHGEGIIDKEEESLHSFVEKGLRNEFYYSGDLERIKSSIDGISGSLSNLITLLMEKDILNVEDLRYIFYISEYKKLELEEK